MAFCDKQNRTSIVEDILNQYKKSKQTQLVISYIDIDRDTNIINVSFAYESYKLPLISGMDTLGKIILDLSKMTYFDRIITTKMSVDKDIFQWMIPLLSDEFTSLMQLNGESYENGINHKSTYDILCDMIARNKLIACDLHIGSIYDNKCKKWLVDETKLIYAIKSTNKLKDIAVGSTGRSKPRNADFALEKLLKQALEINSSVISLNCFGSGTWRDILTERIEHLFDEDIAKKYESWWPLIQKRNKESKMFNKILISDPNNDGIWNNSKCPFNIATKIIDTHLGSIPSLWFDTKGNRCFCWKCHTKRKDKFIYKSGKPSKRYGAPIQWVRFGLKTDDERCAINKVWTEWHVCFHGTTKDNVHEIFKAELTLLKPGDHLESQLGIHAGHVDKLLHIINLLIFLVAIAAHLKLIFALAAVFICTIVVTLSIVIAYTLFAALLPALKTVHVQENKNKPRIIAPVINNKRHKNLGIHSEHIAEPFKRFNKYSKKEELFDPNQIYISPSIKYCGHNTYAKKYYCSHPDDSNRTLSIQFAFQLRIRPGSYTIGQETVGAAVRGIRLDDNFSNNELEWYTKENVGIVLYGLLLKIKEIDVPLKQLEKKKTIKVDEEKKSDE
eukprot:458179_1